MEPAPQPGTLLSERYRLIRPLARGGMGSVWCAEHLALGSEVAVKIIDPVVAEGEMGLPRFLREARALAALHSPYVVQVIDFGSHGELAYLVMELLEGKTLGQRLKAEGKLSAAETHRVMMDVCKAMSHAHDRGIVHRDLKPDNIFLCDASREHVTKVLDFGIAKPTGLGTINDTGTGTGAFLGTPSYMSPEQCRGLTLDRRSDLWALGAITYECLLGKRLFGGDVVGDIVLRICTGDVPALTDSDGVPPGFGAWLERAMAREPGARFQSATELCMALSAVLQADPPSRGVDSAETLSDARLPHSDGARPSGVSSTLANGWLERTAGRSQQRKRAPLRLVAAVSLVIVAAVVAFVRTPPSTPQGTSATERRADEGAALVPAPPTPNVGVAASAARPRSDAARSGSAPGPSGAGTALDAGAAASPLGPRPSRADGVEKGDGQESQPPGTPRRRSTEKTPHEMQMLRRKR